jgi:multicomponent Na+:H+ antiporter subunit A
MLLATVLAPLLLAPFIAVLPASRRPWGWLLAAIPALLFALLLSYAPAIAAGSVFRESRPWLPSIGLNLSFTLDGLSLLFALLISGIGTLIVLYAAGYLKKEQRAFQFQCYLMLFMGAMLGLVLADNMLALFVFWELTTITSFLLVGFMYRAQAARAAARMALAITAGGGLALLGGLILMGQLVRSYELSAVLSASELLREHALYPLILTLVLLGCFTKSAQFPFHFWLPSAMSAPTPASAYLHSATMVKAGIYLMARLYPALGETFAWTYTLVGFGLGTLLLASVAALIQNDLKAMLAYTTVAQLGTLTALIGLGEHGSTALVVGILAHALYKAALFLASGNVQHATHTRDITKLGSLGRAMPFTAGASWIAALSMAGVPPLMGFLGKEKLIEGFYDGELGVTLTLLTVATVALAAIFTVAVALRLAGDTFGRRREAAYTHAPHEAEPLLLLGPLVLSALSLIVVFLPGVGALLGRAAASVAGEAKPVPLAGALWTGSNLTLITSMVALGLGLLLFAARKPAIAALNRLATPYSGAALFERGYERLLDIAYRVGRSVEALRLRQSVLLVFLTLLGMVGYGLIFWTTVTLPVLRWSELNISTLIVLGLIPVSALAAVLANTRLKAIAALGIVGAMVSLIFALYSAPDLALTQLLVETLSLVFMLIAFARLPRTLAERTPAILRWRDIAIAAGVGVASTCLMLLAAGSAQFESIYPYYIDNSLPLANGSNIVNVILVDFRGFDTLGEITVLAVAALGAFAVLRTGQGAPMISQPLGQDEDEEHSLFTELDAEEQELVDERIAALASSDGRAVVGLSGKGKGQEEGRP